MNFNIEEETIKAEIIKAVRLDNKLANISLTETSVFMQIISAISRAIIFVINPVLEQVYESIFIQTSNKYNLSKKLLDAGLPTFKPATKSTVQIQIGSSTLPTQKIAIAQGIIIKTAGDNPIEFELIEASEINKLTPIDANNNYTVSISAQAIITGPEFNVSQDTLTELENEITGIDIVTNPKSSVGGDNIESIKSVKERLLSKKTGSVIGLISWFKSETLKFDGVKKVTIIRKYQGEPGKIGILVTQTGGGTSDNLIEQIQSHFNAEIRNPAGAWHVLVETPTTTQVNFSLNVYYDTQGSIPEKQSIKNIITTYLSQLDIGQDVVLSTVILEILKSGIRDVTISTPNTNVIISANSIATVGTVTITLEEFVDA